MKGTLKRLFKYYVLINFAASLVLLLFLFLGADATDVFWTAPLAGAALFFLLRKKADAALLKQQCVLLAVLALLFTALLGASSGSLNGTAVQYWSFAAFPFLPLRLLGLYDSKWIYITAFLTLVAELAVLLFLRREKSDRKPALAALALAAVCCALCLNLYNNRPEKRYGGHGFDYMHGWSSTDFTDYTVYSEPSKLVTLDHPASLTVEDPADMPILDGAEACYPVYAAMAKAVYKDIDVLERAVITENDQQYLPLNGRIVQFTNTLMGFERLIYPKDIDWRAEERVDMLFASRPSPAQIEQAREAGYELEITPIGREGFVFFVEEDNPVEGLSSEQIRAIYHGDITNWKEVGGKDQVIRAFQRPEGSGSQTRMSYFMGDVSLKEPMTYEVVDAMIGVIREVAQYANEDGAIGYTFRYFLEGLNQEKGVKMLAVDGVYPSLENIRNGSYPLTGQLMLITRKDDPNPYVRKMIDFALSPDGQAIIEQTGYAPLAEP